MEFIEMTITKHGVCEYTIYFPDYNKTINVNAGEIRHLFTYPKDILKMKLGEKDNYHYTRHTIDYLLLTHLILQGDIN